MRYVQSAVHDKQPILLQTVVHVNLPVQPPHLPNAATHLMTQQSLIRQCHNDIQPLFRPL